MSTWTPVERVSRRVASIPSRRGIRMSIKTTSGASCVARATASAPSAASPATVMLASAPLRPAFNASATTASWPTAIARPNSLFASNYWPPPPPCCYPSRPSAATSSPHSPAPTFVYARNAAEASSPECHSSRRLTSQFRSAWTAHEVFSSQSAGTPALLSWQCTLYLCPHPFRRRRNSLLAADSTVPLPAFLPILKALPSPSSPPHCRQTHLPLT